MDGEARLLPTRSPQTHRQLERRPHEYRGSRAAVRRDRRAARRASARGAAAHRASTCVRMHGASSSPSASPARGSGTVEVVDVRPRRSSPAAARPRRTARRASSCAGTTSGTGSSRRSPRRARRYRRHDGEGRASAGGGPRASPAVRPKDRLGVVTRRSSARASGSSCPVPAFGRRARCLRNEPLSRGRGKSHMLQFAFRRGGETRLGDAAAPGGISEAAVEPPRAAEQRTAGWREWCATPSCTRRARSVTPTTPRS